MRVGIAATVRRSIPELATALAQQLMLGGVLLLLVATHANAALTCRDTDAANPGAAGSYFSDCDMTYKNTELMCDTNAVLGSCPKDPMMMRVTPKQSFIKDFNPYMYAYARAPEDKDKPYTGRLYRGTPGDSTQTFGLICPPGHRCPASCSAQIKFPGEAKSLDEEAKMVRLQLDNCTNQYILHSAIYPFQKEGSFVPSNEDPTNRGKTMTLATSCQPLKAIEETKNEYFATDYLKAAWIKLMQDPAYRKNPKAPKEPHLPTGVKIENPIPPPSPFPDVRTSFVGSIKYEEINDPTHPFSPRWDFEFNERDHYSPMTASYSGDPQNAVFCAGDKTKQILKVDILSFREGRLKFDDKITKRIEFNKNCKANSGPQKNPCCLVQGLSCKLMPCATCYGMTQQAPVCSTDYVSQPDRRRVKGMYLPVHPALRVASGLQGLANMSLSNLNQITGGVLNVAQASGLISSQLGVLNMLPGNLPFAQALPFLTGQANLMQALPNLAPQVLSRALGGQSALLGMLPGNLNLNQMTGLLTGQGNILGTLQSATGLPLRSALGVIQSPQNLLNMLPAGSLLGDARAMLNQQASMVRNLVQEGRSIVNTVNRLNNHVEALQGLNPDMPLSQTTGTVANAYRELGLPGTLKVGQARNLLLATSRGLTNFDPNGGIGEYSQLLNSQIGQIVGMQADLPVGQIANVLQASQGILNGSVDGSGRIDTQSLRGITQVMNNQIGQLTGLPVNISPQQLGALIGGQAGLMDVLGSSMNPSQIAGMLNKQLGQLGNIAGQLGQLGSLAGINTGNISGLLSSQLGALSGLPGLSSLGSVAGVIDGNLLGGLPGIGGLPGVPNINPTSGSLPTLVVASFHYQRKAKCNPNEFGEENKKTMAQLCTELRDPFTPLNKLKMRYHNPNDQDTMVLKNGVPEGYSFHEYFKDEDPSKPAHMPYPRLWDTGRSIQKTARADQDPKDDSGQWTTIVGIGHEGTPGNVQPPAGDKREDKAKAMRMKDQRCMYGGWGDSVSMGGASITLPDPVASWTELKLYQTRTLRDFGLSCLGRYEKTVKLGANEERALFTFGGDPSVAVIRSTEPKQGEKEFKTIKEWREENKGGEPNKDIMQLVRKAYPLSWRGYMTPEDSATKFPNFGGGSAELTTGLDNAQVGDIIVMETGASGEGETRGLPRLAMVEAVSPGEYVAVFESDNGKWPDVCGGTDGWSETKTRTMYKPGKLPERDKALFKELNWTSDCIDPHLSHCEAANWDKVKLYRPASDIRKGSDGKEMKQPTPPTK